METQTDVDLEDTIDVSVGDHVRVGDEYGKVHDGLVTAVFGHGSKAKQMESGATYPFYIPAINVIYVTDDDSKSDPYGRQIERLSSVTHRARTTAHGRWWEMAN